MKYGKRIITYMALLVVLLVSLLVTSSHGAQVSKIIGTSVECNRSNPGCTPFPTNVTTVCIATILCPVTFHPSWIDSNRLWGVTGSLVTDTFECITSTNQGVSWQLCTTQPWPSGQSHQVAETSNGNLISVADVAGTCTIKLSEDDAASWITIHTSIGIQCSMNAKAQIVYCQPTNGQCDIGNTLGGTSARLHRSVDNGVTWNVQNIGSGDVFVVVAQGGVEFDGTTGIFGGDIASDLKAVLAAGNTWTLSAQWPNPEAFNYNRGTPLLFNGSIPQMISQNGAQNVYHRTDQNGIIQNIFSPPNGLQAALGSGLRGIHWQGNQYYVVGPGQTIGEHIWITTDNFVTFNILFQSVAQSGRITMYKLHGKIFISLNSGAISGSFFIIS